MQELLTRTTSLDTQAVADCLDGGLGGDLTSDTQCNFAREMRSEQARLQTFLGQGWPAKWGKQLANYGFYCVKPQQATSDCVRPAEKCVRCAFCGLELSGMASAKEAKLQHWQAARTYCPFLKGEDVGNVSAEDKENVAQHANTGGVENFTRYERVNHVGATPAATTPPPRSTPSLLFISASPSQHIVTSPSRHTAATTSHRIETVPAPSPAHTRTQQQQQGSNSWADIVRTARYPQMASFQARLDSLRTWPLLSPTAQQLAKAGLFHVKCSRRSDPHRHHGEDHRYRGECADSVKCFWCGERFHRWQGSDDAMLEHARLSPRCRYVTQILGRQLHDDIIKAGSSHLDNRLFYDEPKPTTLDDVMATAAVQRVLQMGFPYQLVRELLSHNPQRLTADTLCDLVLQAAQQQQQEEHHRAGRTTTGGTHTGGGSGMHCGGQGGTRTGEEWGTPLGGQFGTYIGGEEALWRTTSTGQRHGPTASQPRQLWTGSGGDLGPLTSSQVTIPPPLCPSAPRLTPDLKVTCKVCSAEEVKVTFRPCNHLVCCGKCANFFTHCPVCQRLIEDRMTTYLA